MATDIATLNIQKATEIDTNDILSLIDEFYQESLKEYDLSFTDYTLTKTVENCIKNQIVIVAEDGDSVIGLIAGAVIPSIFDEEEKILQEVMWYIKKDYRKGSLATDLLNIFEEKGKELGVEHILMVHMGNLYADILDRFYKKHKHHST